MRDGEVSGSTPHDLGAAAPAHAPHDRGGAAARNAGTARDPSQPDVLPAHRPARRRELWYALAAIAVVTGLYLWAYFEAGTFPSASGWIGHGIGIAGFVLMLMTATLYSIRKRLVDVRWGAVASWLRFHMFTGLVGSYMVLLHAAKQFHGLAAFALVLTIVVVLSGLTGRYLYTRVPRTMDGPTAGRRAFATWHVIHVPLTWALFAAAFIHIIAALWYATLQR